MNSLRNHPETRALRDSVDAAVGALLEAQRAEMRRVERVLEGIRDRRVRRLVGWEHVLYRIRGDAWLLGDLEVVTLADPPLTFAEVAGKTVVSAPRWRGYVTHRRPQPACICPCHAFRSLRYVTLVPHHDVPCCAAMFT